MFLLHRNRSILNFLTTNFKYSITMALSTSNQTIMDNPQLIAVAQMTATNNKEHNFTVLESLVKRAASRGAKMVFLPEGCDYIAESKQESLDLAESKDGKTLSNYCQLAGSLKIWLSVGGIHIKENNCDKISNTHFIIDDSGVIVEKYAKAHLFDVQIPESRINLQESKYVQEGDAIPNPIQTPCGLVALGICYDMRFAEFSLQYRKANTQILTFPSAFTVTTGLAHWHALLRARAIETQCYVVAAAQTGQHNSKRSSFGHALVIDPWGAVVAEVSEGTGIALAEIDLKYLAKVRREMPVLSHRRNDLYSLHSQSLKLGLTEILPFPRDFVTYPFGQVSIPGNCIFLQTLACNAFVNKKPFTPGHVLIAPQKTILRLCDLEDREICDFAQTLVLALLVLVDKYSPSHVQLAIQDGECAGRTINHVHAHLLPVTDGETLLEKHEEKDSREWRSAEDMASEATELRQSTIKVRKNSDWLSSTNIPTSLHTKDPLGNGPFRVGEMFLTAEKIFFFTGTCFAFLAGDPVLPGHICICPCDPVSSLSHLSPGEVSDIFLSIQKIQQVIEVCFDVSSSTIFVNDGSKGLCVHIVPRKEGDLKRNDDLYSMLSGYELRASGESSDELLLRLKESLGPTTTVEKV